jgi:hypothetical protein
LGCGDVGRRRSLGPLCNLVRRAADAARGAASWLLWAIEGALTDRDWKKVSRDERLSTERKMKQAIEVVVFRAKAGIMPEQLQAAALAVTPALSAMPGFVSREFGESEDGQFIDIVYWKDLASAKQAAEKVMSIPVGGEFFGLIDQSQMQFMHFNKVT